MPYKDPFEYRERQKHYQRDRARLFRTKMVDILGGKCVRCGFSDPRALNIDHVNGDGFIDRKKKRINHEKLFRNLCESVAKKENRYQLLCANCNWIKYYEEDRGKIKAHKGNYVQKKDVQLHLFSDKTA